MPLYCLLLENLKLDFSNTFNNLFTPRHCKMSEILQSKMYFNMVSQAGIHFDWNILTMSFGFDTSMSELLSTNTPLCSYPHSVKCWVGHVHTPAAIAHSDELSPPLGLKSISKATGGWEYNIQSPFKRSATHFGCDWHLFMFTGLVFALSITEKPGWVKIVCCSSS